MLPKATGFFIKMKYGLVLLSDCLFSKGATMADKGKTLKKPALSIKEKRAEKRQKSVATDEFLPKRKRG